MLPRFELLDRHLLINILFICCGCNNGLCVLPSTRSWGLIRCFIITLVEETLEGFVVRLI